jgi:hypothetical protein
MKKIEHAKENLGLKILGFTLKNEIQFRKGY